jgi:hypothetical protein
MQVLPVRKAGPGEALAFRNLGMERHSWVLEEMTKLIGTRRWFETTRTGFSEKDCKSRQVPLPRRRPSKTYLRAFEKNSLAERGSAIEHHMRFLLTNTSPGFFASLAED